MILDCLKCHRPHDVSKYRAGQKLRCMCGQILVVPTDAPNATRSVLTLHCSSCGGDLEKGRDRCAFCGALVDFSSARLTAYCTSCLAVSREGASFCSGCGKPLTENLEAPEEVEELCPRCNTFMRRRTVSSHALLECPMCLGMFVGVDAFEDIIRKQESRVGSVSSGNGQPRKSVLQATDVTYVKCPLCRQVMNRQNYARISGVIIDYCREHGYWLDEGELEKIAAFVATGGLKQKYEIEMEEMKAEENKLRLEREMSSAGDFDPEQGRGSILGGTRLGVDGGGFSLLDIVTRLFD